MQRAVICLSLNEIAATLTRAALGVGWSDGLAKELGRAVSWLAAQGLDGPRLAEQALIQPPRRAVPTQKEREWKFGASPTVALGPSVFELLELDKVESIALNIVTAPGLLVGYAGLAAAEHNVAYAIDIEGQSIFVQPSDVRPSVDGRTWLPRLANLGTDTADEPLKLTLAVSNVHVRKCSSAKELDRVHSGLKEVWVDTTIWQTLKGHAAKSYVPATEASRLKGAGAGLRDAD